jgi:hypothetical protein
MRVLRVDVHVVPEASPISAFAEPRVQGHEGVQPYAGRPCRQGGAGDGIQHPGGHDRDDAGDRLDRGEPAVGALLKAVDAHAAAGKRMPAVMDNGLVPDMGRMTARWP